MAFISMSSYRWVGHISEFNINTLITKYKKNNNSAENLKITTVTEFKKIKFLAFFELYTN